MKKSFKVLISTLILTTLVVGIFLFFDGGSSGENTFANGTTINGIDIGGLTKMQAKERLEEVVLTEAGALALDIIYKDKMWSYNGANFDVTTDIESAVDNIYNTVSKNAFVKRFASQKKLSGGMFNSRLVLGYSFKDMEEKIDQVIAEIEQPAIDATITFNPAASNMFNIQDEQIGIVVDKQQLMDDILYGLLKSTHVVVYVKTNEVAPLYTKEQLTKATKKVASYTTAYTTSTAERKNNIIIASNILNGLVLMPNQQCSFNDIVGARTGENGYLEANVILDGKFEKGIGGGVCQVSTTLYNALVLGGIDVDEVHKHSLPISYVPLALDAMVSYGSADLKFTNNSPLPAFLKVSNKEDKLTIDVYGNTLENNQKLKTRSQLVGEIPHMGDKVIVDTEGKYSDKIMFKGEYIREKYPQVGYEGKSYLQKYIDDILVEEVLIRHEKYQPQQGIVYEGADELPSGMTLPANTVNIIKPQKKK